MSKWLDEQVAVWPLALVIAALSLILVIAAWSAS